MADPFADLVATMNLDSPTQSPQEPKSDANGMKKETLNETQPEAKPDDTNDTTTAAPDASEAAPDAAPAGDAAGAPEAAASEANDENAENAATGADAPAADAPAADATDAPDAPDAVASTEAPADAPADAPEAASADAAQTEETEAKTDAATEAVADAPVAAATEAPADASGDASGDSPADASNDASAPDSSDAPAAATEASEANGAAPEEPAANAANAANAADAAEAKEAPANAGDQVVVEKIEKIEDAMVASAPQTAANASDAAGAGAAAEEDEDDEDDDEEDEQQQQQQSASSGANMNAQIVLLQKQVNLKEREILNLKRSFTDISRQQKEVFIEVENKRKSAIAAGKKYKQKTLKLDAQLKSAMASLEQSRKENSSLQGEMRSLKETMKQKEKRLEGQLNSLKTSLLSVEKSKQSMANEMKTTQGAIDQLLQVDEMNKKLECRIECKDDEATNLSVAKLKFPNLPKEMRNNNEIEIRWFRSHFNDMLLIEGATEHKYHVCADDIGSVIKGEVRSVKLKDCYSSAVIGPIKPSDKSLGKVNESLQRIMKHQVEFNITPVATDRGTMEKLKGSKAVILHFNKDKVKIRDEKNRTFDKEVYNRQMRIALNASNPLQFKLKLKKSKEFLFLAKSIEERDDIAILMRAYYMQLENAKNEKLKLSFYLRLANEIDLDFSNGLGKPGGEMLLTRDALVSKILAPISSQRSNPGGGANMITAPISGPLSERQNSITSQHSARSGALAPNSNAPELSVSALSGQDTYDAEALFPDMFGDLDSTKPGSNNNTTSPTGGFDDIFGSNVGSDGGGNGTEPDANQTKKKKKSKKPRKKSSAAAATETNGAGGAAAQQQQNGANGGMGDFGSDGGGTEDDDGTGASGTDKKIWKGIQFVDKVEKVSDEKLKSITFMKAPESNNAKRNAKKGRGKKRKKAANKPAAAAKSDAAATGAAAGAAAGAGAGGDDVQIDIGAKGAVAAVGAAAAGGGKKKKESYGINAIIEDRVDCLMGLNGDIAKFQIVGSLSLGFLKKMASDEVLTLKLNNLPSQKIFNPKRVKQTVEEDIIQVKCLKDDESINVAKYKWHCDNPSQVCPLKLTLNYNNIENDGVATIECKVLKQNNMDDVAVSQLSILGTIEMSDKTAKIVECIETEPKKMQGADCEFHWSKTMATKFMFKLSGDITLKDGKAFICKFKQVGGTVAKVQIKATFEMSNFGLSNIEMVGGTKAIPSMIDLSDNKRKVVSGDYIVSDQS